MLLGKRNSHIERTETRSPSLTLYQYQLKFIKDLNIKSETFIQLQEVVGNALDHISIGNDFLNRTPGAQNLRERMNK
jgi:hypothetical protein